MAVGPVFSNAVVPGWCTRSSCAGYQSRASANVDATELCVTNVRVRNVPRGWSTNVKTVSFSGHALLAVGPRALPSGRKAGECSAYARNPSTW